MDLEDAKQKARKLFDGIECAKDCTLIEVGRREAAGLGFVEQIQSMTPPELPLPVRGGFLIRSNNFSEIAALFDEFDAFAREVAFRYPLMWIESGLDVAFNANNVREYQEAMSSDEHFKQFIEFMQRLWERQENMEH